MQEGIPTSIAIIIASAILGAFFLVGTVIAAVLSRVA
jgi:hypothetical protein